MLFEKVCAYYRQLAERILIGLRNNMRSTEHNPQLGTLDCLPHWDVFERIQLGYSKENDIHD